MALWAPLASAYGFANGKINSLGVVVSISLAEVIANVCHTAGASILAFIVFGGGQFITGLIVVALFSGSMTNETLVKARNVAGVLAIIATLVEIGCILVFHNINPLKPLPGQATNGPWPSTFDGVDWSLIALGAVGLLAVYVMAFSATKRAVAVMRSDNPPIAPSTS